MIMMKANKQHFNSNLSIFLHIILLLVIFLFAFSISKSFPFILTIPIAFLSIVFLITLKKKKESKNEGVVQEKLFKEKLQPSFHVGETEFNQHEEMQQVDLQSDSSLPSDSERSIASIVGETFEIDYNEYQNVSSCDGLDSDTDDGDGDYEYEKDNEDEQFNRIIVNTNCNIDRKESSLLSYTTSVYPRLGIQF